MKVTALQGQSSLDLAIQTGGSVEAVFEFARQNNISITGKLQAGDEFRTAAAANRDIAAYYGAKNLKPATSVEYREELMGIGYMIIGYNFTVA